MSGPTRGRLSVSVVVPTHDRSDLVDDLLESFLGVERPTEVEVEVLVVANACSDDTVAGGRTRAEVGFPVSLRLIEEPVPGLNLARNRGAREASGEILAYLDDDVLLDPSWLTGLAEGFTTHGADLASGRLELLFDAVPRPPWLGQEAERLLSRLDLGGEVLELPRPGLAVGANLALRAAVLARLGGFAPRLDRAEASLLSGGDTELASRAHDAGHRLLYLPRMAARHRVAAHRVSLPYLAAVAQGRGRTRVALAPGASWRRLLRLARTGLAQMVVGGGRALAAALRRRPQEAIAGRLLVERGRGTVAASLGRLFGRQE